MGQWNPFRLNRRIRALVLTVVLGVMLLVVYAAGILIPQDAVAADFIHAKQPPSSLPMENIGSARTIWGAIF